MKKNEARLVPAKNCSRNGLPSWGVWSNTTTVMHHAFTQSIQLIRSFIMLSQSSIKIVDDDENRDFQKWTQKEMGAEAPSGCAKKTEEGRVDDGEEEHIVSQEDEIG